MAVAISAGQLEELLGRAAFARVYDFRLHSFAEGECVIEVPFNRELERPGGILTGVCAIRIAHELALFPTMLRYLGACRSNIAKEWAVVL